MEVLFEYQGIRTILRCKRSKIAEKIENNLAELAVLPQTSASAAESALEVHTLHSIRIVRGKPKSGTKYYLLQRHVKEWNAFINIDNTEQIKNRDILTVVPFVTGGAGGISSAISSQTELAETKGKSTVTSVTVVKKKKLQTAVNTIVLKSYSSKLPKDNLRRKMAEDGRIKTVYFSREDDFDCVNKKIKTVFGIEKYGVLECDRKSQRLSFSHLQSLDGHEAIKRRRALYLCEKPHDGDTKENTCAYADQDLSDYNTSDGDLPDPDPVFNAPPKKRQRRLLCSKIENPTSSDSLYLPEVKGSSPVVISDSDTDLELEVVQDDANQDNREIDTALEEFRCIRAEQDKEFEDSLEADRKKAEDITVNEQKHEKLAELRRRLREKYMTPANNGITIAFRFPDGTKAEHKFSSTDVTKRLYQYVFGNGDFSQLQSFHLSRMVPRETIPCSGSATLKSFHLNEACTLAVIFDDGKIMDQLEDEKDESECDLLQLQGQAEKALSIIESTDAKRLQFVKIICPSTTKLPHVIERRNVFADMLNLFSQDKVLEEFPLRIEFKNELAFDSGGVCRDMFSAFWEDAYMKYFDGSSLLSPMVHANISMESLPKLGKVLSHGFLVCGFLPVRVAFPVLASILMGPTIEIQPKILVQTFAESLCSYEASLVKQALVEGGDAFSDELQANMITILSRYGSRMYPSPANLKSQLSNIAKYELQIKPMASICSMNSGIPNFEKPFWDSFSIDQLYLLYLSLNATPAKVLSVIDEPFQENDCQSRVFGYLRQYIGDMKMDEVRRFLRFVTGSSVLIAEHITISFNGLSGLARRPIAQTCSCTLELPSTYQSFLEFKQEFTAILADEDYNWDMLAV